MAIQLDSKQARTSFGKLPMSTEKTAPNFSFGHGKREKQDKVYLGELTQQENIAKGSPGPVYMYDDQVKFRTVSYKIQISLTSGAKLLFRRG